MLINYLKKNISNCIIENAKHTNKTFNYNIAHIKDINIINKELVSEKLKLNDKCKTDEKEIVNFLHIGRDYPIYPLASINPENFLANVYNYLVKRIKICILKIIQLIYIQTILILKKIKEHL